MDQNDPNRVPPQTSRRTDGSWGLLPLLAGIAAVLLLAFLIFGPREETTTGVATQDNSTQTTVPKPSTPPAANPTTSPPTPQK